MSKVIAISNQKGGVGKTTTSMNLASALSYEGKKVLLIDLDPQGNATQGFLALQAKTQPTMYSVLVEELPIEEAVFHKVLPTIDIIPSDYNLSGADLVMDKLEHGKESVLRKSLEPIRDKYDYILIDCPPSLGLLNTNALTAADSVLIPVQCEYYALEGITQLMTTIILVQKLYNPKLTIEGVLMTMFDIRTRLSVEVSKEIRQNFGEFVYQNSIPRNIRLSEAPSRGKSIFEYEPDCAGAHAYKEFTKEFLKRNGE